MKHRNIALMGHGFVSKAHSYAYLARPFFFKTGIEPVQRVMWGPDDHPLRQAAAACQRALLKAPLRNVVN